MKNNEQSWASLREELGCADPEEVAIAESAGYFVQTHYTVYMNGDYLHEEFESLDDAEKAAIAAAKENMGEEEWLKLKPLTDDRLTNNENVADFPGGGE